MTEEISKTEKQLSMLAWTKADYLIKNEEIPDCLIEDDLHTEGELMSTDEISSWIEDTEKTFFILSQENESLFNKLYDEYVIDIHYLIELGKIDEDEGMSLLDKKRFRS